MNAGALACPVLEGRLVRLEPLTLGHLEALLAAATADRETFGMTWVPGTQEEMRDYIEEALEADDVVAFATVEPATGSVVGSTRFAAMEWWVWEQGNPHNRGDNLPDSVEIGWTWLAPAAQGTGINTEAKLLQLTHAFETWRVHHVMLKTDERNTRSRAAIERLGATFEGILHNHMPAADGGIRNTARYTVTEAEWLAVKARIETLLVDRAGG